MTRRRRDFLKAIGALACAALPGRPSPDAGAAEAPSAARPDLCAANGASASLFIPGRQGLFGRLAPGGARLTMRAAAIDGSGPWTQGFHVEHRGARFVNPTLVLQRGEPLSIDLDNALHEPTSVHWHGLAVATRNDGGVTPPTGPGQRYAYAFDVRDRSSLYWYHPHPHGLTAGQVYRGMFGLIEVEDDDERALRGALDLAYGRSEIPLLLQDRRGAGYAANDADRMHGRLGDQVVVNGAVCPHLDVATRIYRFRVLNASNARTYRLGFRSADGKPLSFTLIGTDGGLLAAPRRCDDAFLATAERIDILVDLVSSCPDGGWKVWPVPHGLDSRLALQHDRYLDQAASAAKRSVETRAAGRPEHVAYEHRLLGRCQLRPRVRIRLGNGTERRPRG